METRKTAYSQIKTKFQGAIPALETCSFLGVNLYDHKYRALRTYAENYLGGDDLLLSKYDFIGTVLKTKQLHVKDAVTAAIEINQRMDYDHAFRLTEVYHQVGTNPEVLMTALEYNELGQTIKKKLNQNIDGSFLQEIDFEYNIRGWTTKINDPDNLGNDLFAMQLAYNDNIGLSANAQYNGNISAIKWANSEEIVNHGYAFDYDNVNRIIKGDHFENSAVTSNFDLDLVSYDANGNIETLSRFGAAGKHIDDLAYAYNNTNQLQSVSDIATNYEEGFFDGANNLLEYDYDNNGNLIFDNNKGIINIEYNYLNLPLEVDFGSGNKINFIYDATGVKQARLISGTETGNRYYIGNMEYNETMELEYIHTNEGRVRLSGSELHYDYYLKDHLGNTRVVFTEDDATAGVAEALQVDNYYPFGMRFNQAPVIQKEENNYLYNGKELQENYGLSWIDYGWRMYDPAIGRWHCIDKLSEKYYTLSNYVYCANNPIRLIDVDGRWFDDKNEKKAKKLEKKLNKQIKKLTKQVAKLEKKGKDIGDRNDRIGELNNSKTDVTDMRSNDDVEFRYASVDSKSNPVLGSPNADGMGTSVVTLYVEDNVGSQVHEGRHGGDIARGTLTAKTYGVQDEISAYRAQYSYNGKIDYLSTQSPTQQVMMQRIQAGKNPMVESITNINQIKPSVVNSMADPGFNQIYPPGGITLQQWNTN